MMRKVIRLVGSFDLTKACYNIACLKVSNDKAQMSHTAIIKKGVFFVY